MTQETEQLKEMTKSIMLSRALLDMENAVCFTYCQQYNNNKEQDSSSLTSG
jgi:hypothetical protein